MATNRRGDPSLESPRRFVAIVDQFTYKPTNEPTGQLTNSRLPTRTNLPYRTLSASRDAGRAHESAELHECLIVRPGGRARARQQLARDAPDRLLTVPRFEIGLRREHTLDHP